MTRARRNPGPGTEARSDARHTALPRPPRLDAPHAVAGPLLGLSWIQQEMLDAFRAVGDPALFVTQIVLPGADRIDIDRLRASWRRTGAGFAALRTSLAWAPDLGFVRVVAAEAEPLGVYTPAASEAGAPGPPTGPSLEEVMLPWLDRQAPLAGLFSGRRLARLDVTRYPPRGTALVLTFNHLALDGCSASTVLTHLLADLADGARTPEPDLPDHLACYGIRSAAAAWPGTENLADSADAGFWRDLVDSGGEHRGATPALSRLDLRLSELTSRALLRLARDARVTAATVLHAACAIAASAAACGRPPRMTTAVLLRGLADGDDLVDCLQAEMPFALDLGLGTPVQRLLTDTQALLAELHYRAPGYGAYREWIGADRPSGLYLAVGNFPVPAPPMAQSADAPFSVERPSAPLSVFAVPAVPFHLQLVRRPALPGLDAAVTAECLEHVCARLPLPTSRVVGDVLASWHMDLDPTRGV